jgi:RimJ/RimL family protein N-acetyltransferase
MDTSSYKPHLKHYIETINNTPAVFLIMEGYLLLHQQSRTSQIIPLYSDDRAIVAFDPETDAPIGVVSYRNYKYLRSNTISLVYVQETYRRRGVFSTMWNYLLEQTLRDEDLTDVIITTSVHNSEMQAALKKLNVAPIELTYTRRIRTV